MDNIPSPTFRDLGVYSARNAAAVGPWRGEGKWWGAVRTIPFHVVIIPVSALLFQTQSVYDIISPLISLMSTPAPALGLGLTLTCP